MEILIPGLVLVGLMVWASTRIKRNASRAFEREQIETPEFSLTKPEGMLSLVDPPDGLLFSAYSKEFGTDAAGRVRKITAEVRRFLYAHFDEIVERAKADSISVVSEQTGIISGNKCANMLLERNVDDVTLEEHYKIIAGSEVIYQLSVAVLPEYKDDLQRGVDDMLNSFSLP